MPQLFRTMRSGRRIEDAAWQMGAVRARLPCAEEAAGRACWDARCLQRGPSGQRAFQGPHSYTTDRPLSSSVAPWPAPRRRGVG